MPGLFSLLSELMLSGLVVAARAVKEVPSTPKTNM
jgi:hypothetical protein